MKKTFSIGMCMALAAAYAGNTFANELSYDYVQLSYVATDVDGLDLDGASLDGSLKLNDNVFVVAGFAHDRSDRIGGVRAEVDSYNLGLGYRYGLNQQTDLVAAASWIRGKVKVNYGFGSLSESDNGYSLDVGLRHLLTPQVELNAAVNYSDIFNDDDTALNLAALFHATHNLSVGVGYSVGSDVDGWAVGVRLNF